MPNITMDKKYKIASGEEVRILCIDAPGELSVAGMVIEEHGPCLLLWPADGKSPNACAGYYDLVEDTPYAEFYRGQPVIVSESTLGCNTARRYFSHETDGTAYCFLVGGDAWSNGEIMDWPHCRALTAEEQAEYDALMNRNPVPCNSNT